jgi:peptide/nickel transport system ATP-binding protein
MYAGRLVEMGTVRDVVQHPQHPYTAGLMGAIPVLGAARERLQQIDGAMPRLDAIPSGCAFHPRCPHAFDRCRSERPELLPAGASAAACWLHAEIKHEAGHG